MVIFDVDMHLPPIPLFFLRGRSWRSLPDVIQNTSQYANNRIEESYEPTRIRERAMRRFKSVRCKVSRDEFSSSRTPSVILEICPPLLEGIMPKTDRQYQTRQLVATLKPRKSIKTQ